MNSALEISLRNIRERGLMGVNHSTCLANKHIKHLLNRIGLISLRYCAIEAPAMP